VLGQTKETEAAVAKTRAAEPVRILIADDHELVRRGMCAILNQEPGWVVCGEAATGREALNMATELRPDIVILDLSLPEMNGLDVTRHVRSLSIPVLIVTVQNAESVMQDAIDAGANGYMLKADAGRTLTEAIRAILQRGEFFQDKVRAAVDLGSLHGVDGTGQRRPARVTLREREVLHLLAEGWANKEIAEALGITTKTVETHRARIMAKLELHSMSELVRYAIRNRIIEP
jgi:DNA-binding NarL/FixJ family response regulator